MKLCFTGVVPLKAGIHLYSLLININKFSPKKRIFETFVVYINTQGQLKNLDNLVLKVLNDSKKYLQYCEYYVILAG